MDKRINNMTIQEKIGQMIMVGIDGTTITERMKKLILEYKVGGVILYKRNYNNYDELVKIICELKNLNKNNKFPLLIAIDQEGGRVNRLPKEIKNLPSAKLLSETKDLKIVEKAADITAKILSKARY